MPALTAALSDQDWEIGCCAAVSLGKTDDDAAFEPLQKLLTDNDWKLRGAAIVGLMHWSRDAAVEPILGMLADPHPVVARAAHHALRTISRKYDAKPDAKAWRAWWTEAKGKHDFTDRLMILQTLSDAENAELQGHLTQVQELETRKTELETLREDADEILAELDEQRDEIEAEIADLEVLLEQVTPAPEPPPVNNPGYSGDSAVVDFAYAQLGKPYQYGSGGPNSWDCSGLTKGAWANAGVSLSHNVQMQWNETTRVSRDELRPGDIVFYSGLGHAGIYIGDGQIIHAPHTGAVVRIADMGIMSIQGYGRP